MEFTSRYTVSILALKDWGLSLMVRTEDKGFEMMAADNSGSQGKCTPDAADDYTCNCTPSLSGGRRIFSCKSSIKAEDFGLLV
jgi:hypothetical protein